MKSLEDVYKAQREIYKAQREIVLKLKLKKAIRDKLTKADKKIQEADRLIQSLWNDVVIQKTLNAYEIQAKLKTTTIILKSVAELLRGF